MATSPTTGRRIRAALALAGYSIEELSEQIGQRGLGPRTLRKLQDDNDPREARAWELRAIAEACDLPYSWFTVENFKDALEVQGDDTAQHLDEVAERVEDLDRQITDLRSGMTALVADSLRHTQALEALAGTGHRSAPEAGES